MNGKGVPYSSLEGWPVAGECNVALGASASPESNDYGLDLDQALQGVELALTSLLCPSVRVCSSVALESNPVGSILR